MIWNIIADSSCDLEDFTEEIGPDTVTFHTVPFIITAGGRDFVDDNQVPIPDMLDAMEGSPEASRTACPSVAVWLDAFRKAGNTIAVTISKELSGSYSSACVAKDQILAEMPEKQIAVINSMSAGTGLTLLVETLCEQIRAGAAFDSIIAEAEHINREKCTIFALSSFQNLIKNGRVKPFVGFIAQKLGFWGIGIASAIGTIEIVGKVRGAKHALDFIAEDIRKRKNDAKRIIISHCQNPEMAEKLKAVILAERENACVEIHETRALCSYYAERHGLIIAYV